MTLPELCSLICITISITAGTLIYAILMRLHWRHLPAVGVGAAMTYVIFALLWEQAGWHLFFANMVAAMAATIYAEIMARVLKAPVAIYSNPSIIPLVPGGSLYYTMAALMEGNRAELISRGSDTLMTALGIAVGIIAVSVIDVFLPRPGFKHHKR